MKRMETWMKPVRRCGIDTDCVKKNPCQSVQSRTGGPVSSVFLSLLLFISSAHAQCDKLGFLTGDIYSEPRPVACVPLSLTASTRGINSRDPSYVFEYNGRDESKLTINPVYYYNKPGKYQILQISTVDGKPARTCATVYVLDTLPPKFSFMSCGTSLTISITTSTSAAYDSYNLDWGDGQTTNGVLATDAGQLVHQYATRQSYRVRVDGRYRIADCGGKAFRVFTPGEPPKPPTISRLEPNGQQVRVYVGNEDGGLFALEQKIGTGGFKPVVNGSRAGSSQLTAPLDTTQTNCFRLVQIDPCFPPANFAATCYEPPKPKLPTGPVLTWWVPSAFTPNGDGQNDTFGVIGQTDPDDFQLSILNRWGIVIFRTTDPIQAWNGTVAGEPAPVGQYGFLVLNGRSGVENNRKSGILLLVR